jgi:geranylgeranylglycerol-phosphate geranylgeranyltransferase
MMKPWFRISRPFNVVITACAVFIGALLTGTIFPFRNVILAILSASSICAGGNILNDFFDVEVDRINKPQRPIPSGKISKTNALLISILLMILGLVLSFFISLEAIILALIAITLLTLYNSYLKRKGSFFGNLSVSITGALPLIYGGLAVGRIEGTLFPATFAFMTHLGREVIKDMEDVAGDRTVKSRSIPVRFGLRISYRIAFIPLFLLIAITPIPYFLKVYNLIYLVSVIIAVDILLVVSFLIFRTKLTKKNLHILSEIIKLSMVFGLFSLILGTL